MDERAKALEDVYRRRYAGFRNALATVTESYDTARDAVQEGFARALRSREAFRGGSIEAWVWQIALHAALESRRNGRVVVSGDLPQADLVDADRDPILAEAIRALPPRRRLIVFLRYYADLSYDQIADACGISEGTVAATLSQAHAALEEAIAEKENAG